MNIADILGVIPGLKWLFELLPTLEVGGVRIPLQYGFGLFLSPIMLYLLAVVFENRWLKITRQYRSVKVGDLAIAVVFATGFWILDTMTPPDQTFWYQFGWFQYPLLAVCLSVSIYLKALELLETRRKCVLWNALDTSEAPSTDWLNTDHSNDYFLAWIDYNYDRQALDDEGYDRLTKLAKKLRYGVAYSWKQHASATSIGHTLVFAVMLYTTLLTVAAVFTQIRPGGAGTAIAFMLMLIGGMVWVITVFLDNKLERPDLLDVHPDTGWFPRVRELFRSSQHEQESPTHTGPPIDSYGSQGGGQPLVDEILGAPRDTGEAYRPSFGRFPEAPPEVHYGPISVPPAYVPSVVTGVRWEEPPSSSYDDSGAYVPSFVAPSGAYMDEDSGLPVAPAPSVPAAQEPAPELPAEPEEPATVTPGGVQILSASQTRRIEQDAIDAVDPQKQPGTPDADGTPPPTPGATAPVTHLGVGLFEEDEAPELAARPPGKDSLGVMLYDDAPSMPPRGNKPNVGRSAGDNDSLGVPLFED